MDKHNLLHPPFQVKNFKDKDNALFINGMTNGELDLGFLGAHFKPLSERMCVAVKDLSKFLDSYSCQNVKSTVFNISDPDNGYRYANLAVRQMVYEEFRKRKFPICIIHPHAFSITPLLNATNIESKNGETVLVIVSMGVRLGITELRRKTEGYSYLANRDVVYVNRSMDDLKAGILGTCDPDYVLIVNTVDDGALNALKSRVFPSKNVIVVDIGATSKYMTEFFKAFFNPGNNQVLPFSIDTFAVTNEPDMTDLKHAVITINKDDELPFEEVKVVSKSKKPYYVSFFNKGSKTYEPAGKAEVMIEHHRIQLSLVVDRNSLPFLYQEAFVIPQIQALPQKLSSSKAALNIPVIGFYDNSSVICVRDENGYKFLESWNGLYGNDLYLCFEQEEPAIITDLTKVKDNDPFVVYDLIKILSMPSNSIQVDPKWGFKVTHDTKNPVLLEINNYIGNRESQTPFFFMALLLKYHVNAIKHATRKKPKELGFCLFTKFTKNERKRIQSGLEESCKLLKIDFVFVNDV